MNCRSTLLLCGLLWAVPHAVFAGGAWELATGNIPVIQNANLAPEDMAGRIEAAIDRAQQITTAMEQLLTLNQSLQYQVRAAQALSEGSWDSFVEFFNYQTAAMMGFNSTVANLNNITGMFAKEDVFTSDSYKELVLHSNNINRSMQAANDMVRSTDSLVKATEYNAMVMQQGLRDVAGADNVLKSLQGQAKIFSAIGSESRAATQLMYTQQRYLLTLVQNAEDTAAFEREKIKMLTEAPDPLDPTNPYGRTEASDRIKETFGGGGLINGAERSPFLPSAAP
ncbi:MAG: hypothetical protein LBP76_03915 [Treponema sp.]|jgi:hypothetical protein|nr:hypothetical protein [Treponema sp.]